MLASIPRFTAVLSYRFVSAYYNNFGHLSEIHSIMQGYVRGKTGIGIAMEDVARVGGFCIPGPLRRIAFSRILVEDHYKLW